MYTYQEKTGHQVESNRSPKSCDEAKEKKTPTSLYIAIIQRHIYLPR